jgi:hypothetical protein
LFCGFRSPCSVLRGYQSGDTTNGYAVIQNVFEFSTNNRASASFDFGSSNSRQYTNILIWHNTVVGAKTFMAYNDSGNAAAWRVGWSIRYNLLDDWNIKSDTFAGGSGPNGNRVGNWSVLYGVGCSGNVFAETTGVGAAGSFLNEFCGLNTFSQNLPSGKSGDTQASSYMQFIERKSYDGVTDDMPGGGDYRIQADAPQRGLARDWCVPYDLAGSDRCKSDVPGAYAYPSGTFHLQAAEYSAAGFVVTVGTSCGRCYTLESKGSLPGSQWSPVMSICATGAVSTLSDSNAKGALGLYRVREL